VAWFLVFFFVSGLCSVLYELIWLRLAMAQFGVTSALVSIVLSMFMAGLGLGSWASGYFIHRRERSITFPALRLYALTELLIGISAVVVPREFVLGRTLLSSLPVYSSAAYYLASGVWIALTLLPWCACMGATFPVAMLAIRNSFPQDAQRSFSYLYVANVCGAVAGALLPLLLIELYGFHGTLKVGAAMNVLLAAGAMALTLRPTHTPVPASADSNAADSSRDVSRDKALSARQTRSQLQPHSDSAPLVTNSLLALLFGTGCASMGIEVVWIRQFTPYLGTVVYAFALILATYLLATFFGSRIYRRRSRTHEQQGLPWVWLGFTALLSSVTASPQFHLSPALRLLLGVAPFSGVLGFITPMLVDRWSGGDPEKAGSAYAVNVLGCIVGPLLSGFLLLPLIGERWVALIFALPWLVIGANPRWWSLRGEKTGHSSGLRQAVAYAAIGLSLIAVFISKGYEDRFAQRVLLRDNTATVIATGEDMGKRLLVNGVGMSTLTPITKMMAHLPLAFLDHPPQKALVICFGMGTTYRSLLSWNISATAVELVPSVPSVFWYFHPDGPQLLRSPLSHVVIDDGRRYLERTSEDYDVITIDPPPPLAAAGSSMLYSTQFYAAIRQHLVPGGILQQWLPYGDVVEKSAVAEALRDSFPYVRVFQRLPEGRLVHFIASAQPIPARTPRELVSRMPSSAIQDLMEWGPEDTPELEFAALLDNEVPIDAMIAADLHVPALQDDRPANEYYVLRRYFGYKTVERLSGN
jgi:spermidine synthase